jgi:hypothetical protein
VVPPPGGGPVVPPPPTTNPPPTSPPPPADTTPPRFTSVSASPNPVGLVWNNEVCGNASSSHVTVVATLAAPDNVAGTQVTGSYSTIHTNGVKGPSGSVTFRWNGQAFVGGIDMPAYHVSDPWNGGTLTVAVTARDAAGNQGSAVDTINVAFCNIIT